MSQVRHFYFQCQKCWGSTNIFFNGYVQPVLAEPPECPTCKQNVKRTARTRGITVEQAEKEVPKLEIKEDYRETRTGRWSNSLMPIPEKYRDAFGLPKEGDDK